MRRVPLEPIVAAEAGRYEDLIINAPIAVYRATTSGKLLDGNAALARMLGRRSLEDLLAENGQGPFGTDARRRFWTLLEKEGQVNGFESEWVRPDGRKVYLRENARVVRGSRQNIVCYEGTLEDISDRRAAEKQIQSERDFSSAIIDNAASLVIILDREGRIVRFNQACEAASGFDFHDVAEQPVWDVLCPPERRQQCREYFDTLMSGAFPGSHESTWVTRSGEMRQIAWSDSPLLNDAGEIRNIIAIGIDITDRKMTEDALRRSESRYRELFESASDIIFRANLNGDILSINAAAERLTGYSRDDVRNIAQVVGPDQMELIRRMLVEKVQGAPDTRFILKVRAADGSDVLVDLNTTLSYQDGKPVEVLGIGRDITWRIRADESERGRREILEMTARHEPLPAVLRRIEQLIEAEFPHSVCSIELTAETDPFSSLALQNRATCKDPLYQPLEPADPQFASGYRMRWQLPVLSAEHQQLALMTLLVRRDQPPAPAESCLLTTKIRLATLTIEHHRMTEGIRWDAQHDKLTGLLNREVFEEKLNHTIAHRPAGNPSFAVFLIDLDRFKLINDTLGHPVGDVLLKAIAGRLAAQLDDRGYVARMSGDEFIVLIDPVLTRDEADWLGHELLACFQCPFEADSQELFVNASIGCSMYPWDGEDVQTLRRNADTAMYRAKSSGRNRLLHFAPKMTAGLARRLKIQNELHRAADRGELQLLYQPQHDLATDQLIGVEALIRWNSRELGLVCPGEFIPVAEDSGLVVDIGTWVLHEACRQSREWRDAGFEVKVAVNVSAWQFARPDFVDTVRNALIRNGIPGSMLELELTETVLMQDPLDARTELDRLQQTGVMVAIDDFGTGYSSLAYLHRLPIQSLKIDLSFVRSIPETEEIPPLIRGITALAHGLNIGVLAEGVEHPYQARVLRSAGCDRVQGHLFGRPATPDVITNWLRAGYRPSSIAGDRDEFFRALQN